MDNKSVIIDFPIKLLKYELKEYLEYNFKVYIKKEVNDIIVYGNSLDLDLCQKHAEYFKSVDSQFLLHLNKFSEQALNISSLKLFYQSKCKVLMSISNKVLYIFGQLFNVTCIYNYLCHYTNMIETDVEYDFNEKEETDLNLMCRTLSITLSDTLCKKTKFFIYLLLQNHDELFSQFDDNKHVESNDVPSKSENINTSNQYINKDKSEEDIKFLNATENDATSLLQPIPGKLQKYRTVIIDGSNVAFEHGNGTFSPLGIKLAVDHFINRGMTKVYAFLPRHRQALGGSIFPQMELSDHLKYTPSRIINNVRETPYDDRFILDAALAMDGVVVSNDQYRDLMSTEKYKDIICKRLIPYTFVEDHIIIPNDPRGPNGPSLDDMLKNFEKCMIKSPRKQTNQLRKNRTHSFSRQNGPGYSYMKSTKPELKGHQIDLYKRAYDILPSYGPAIRNVILENPQVTDLNNVICWALQRKPNNDEPH